jgi:wobble nucleotide-excising tRNase
LTRLPVKDEQNKNPKKRFYALEKGIRSREPIVTIPKKGMIESEDNQMWDILKTTIAKISDDNNDEENKIYKYTVQNTMRRIYESFFENTCNYKHRQIADLYHEATDRNIFREFVDWINEGSHSADMADIKSLPSNGVILNYMKVFESAFDITGNHGQFKQMMK